MMECLQKHFEKLQVLRITKNRIGVQGASHLAASFLNMKVLSILDLSHNEIGDLGMEELAENLSMSPFNLEEMDISGNHIGKNPTYFARVVPCLIKAFSHFGRMHTLKMGFNNLRGDQSGNIDKLLTAFIDMTALKHLDLQSNILGQNFGTQLDRKPPPICLMSDVLIKTLSLKDLNISNNQMETKSVVSIAHGLSHTQTLEHIDISGNPIGKYGLRLLLQSMSNNKDT